MSVAEVDSRSLRLPMLSSLRSGPWSEPARFAAAVLATLTVFGVLLLIQGLNPLTAYRDIFDTTLRTRYGFSEVLVRMIPVLLCALAVSVPARVGLVNIGGEGQLYLGAWSASLVALHVAGLPAVIMLPLMFVVAAAGGALWALGPALLRAKGWLNEAISTLLLNYVAILFVQYFVFGPWKDPQSANFPQSKAFVPAALLPTFGSYRVHVGIIFGLVGAVLLYFILRRTRWGYEMRAIGGNVEAARRSGIAISAYIVVSLLVGGAVAGLAGFGEVLAIQGRRLRT